MCSPSKCPVIYSSNPFFFNICQKLLIAVYGSHFFVSLTLNCVEAIAY